MINTKIIAGGIYSAAADMDHDDYSETAETDIKDLETALNALTIMASNNRPAAALLSALRMIYED